MADPMSGWRMTECALPTGRTMTGSPRSRRNTIRASPRLILLVRELTDKPSPSIWRHGVVVGGDQHKMTHLVEHAKQLYMGCNSLDAIGKRPPNR
jgi:hypothetical protein